MLWSLGKVILFVAAMAALTVGAAYLIDEAQGGIRIEAMGREVSLSAFQSVVALIVLMLIAWFFVKVMGFLYALYHFMLGDETAISRFFARNRERRGYDALAQGMVALASGEGRQALAKAEKADKYLNRPELTMLLTAQAAEVAGDRKKATETYRKMVENDKTRFVGVRGIMKQKLSEGDTETALKLAQKAFALKPTHVETQDTLLRLQAQKSDWKGARETLSAKLRHGALPRDVYKRREAVMALGEAKEVLDEDRSIEAREAAIEANRLSPDLIPAAVMAAQALIEKDQKRPATRILKKAWEAQPHPDLAGAFAAIEPDETPADRLKRFGLLTRINPQDPETRMLEAELKIAAEDFPGAKRALGDLYETDPTVRTATLMAAIERGSGAPDSVVQAWLAKAVVSPRGPQWVCENCQHIHAQWVPICEHCEAFDTLAWTRPPEAELALPGGAEMLPLLIGPKGQAPDDAPVEQPPVVVNGEDMSSHESAKPAN